MEDINAFKIKMGTMVYHLVMIREAICKKGFGISNSSTEQKDFIIELIKAYDNTIEAYKDNMIIGDKSDISRAITELEGNITALNLFSYDCRKGVYSNMQPSSNDKQLLDGCLITSVDLEINKIIVKSREFLVYLNNII